MKEDKTRAVELAVAQVERAYGKGAIMRIGAGAIAPIPAVSSGDIGLDIAMGVGGYPLGRVTEIYGPEASGKTTLALHAVAEVQKKGGIAAFIDAEHALDLRYAKLIGIMLEELLISQPDWGEQALDIVEKPQRAAMRSSSIPPSAWTCARSVPSRTATRWWAPVCASRW